MIDVNSLTFIVDAFRFYFQPPASNIRIASFLLTPNIFKSSGSFLKVPHALTISFGSILGLTEYSYVLFTYISWASSLVRYSISFSALDLLGAFFARATPETFIWDPLSPSPWFGKNTEIDFPAFTSSSFSDESRSPI